ncbi:MAG: hypothetical protein A2951_00975 [Candidatus Buchananbacteria bacterium RIFCSPLOWO2_01_FULL_56_15]|uniref:Rrf2 family transcriptional regulator n=2 Tax=Candidatus Buchananiibacteriota TaxID=1817903 RepID=A0A1G1YF14_9BACT|nr:MAG: hypothetical protein A3J59_00300 [Candidatus Buchananbacteria bacterium RIFCSPHIGHO2_02_FULL_56_16]OGY55394.1 MAG: hypothetical protein A2951_00975 [Candidatus Buchananbacteria bacterium RIFCSPLOWO2_01_FULL_56_15]
MSYLGTISTREYTGLRLVLRLAQTYRNRQPVSLTTVSQFENVSPKYLEQLVAPFRRAGWLESRRGRDGGYVMIKDPQTISLRDIIALLGNQPYLISCLDRNRRERCQNEQRCAARRGLDKAQQAIEQTLSGISLAELLR